MKRPPFGLSKHYSTVSSRYDRLYEMLFGENQREVTRYLSDKLIGSQHQFLSVADIGGGTGLTIEMLKSLQPKERRFVLVEPYAQMAEIALQRASPPDAIFAVSAEEFADDPSQSGQYDVLICKEMIHHVAALEEFFEGCFSLLKSSGAILIITRPVEVEFPFGKHTRRQWKESYATAPEEMPRLLERAGFSVMVEKRTFPVAIDKRSWLECVGPNPLFSTLSLLTSKEKEEDLAELRALPRQLHFNDHIIFILGKKG